MASDSSIESNIVAALETASEPLERRALRERVEESADEFDAALAHLRGQEVVRKLGDTDTYRLTYWPDSRQCILCDDDITSKEYYELELEAHGISTEKETTGSLHADCARALLDNVSLSELE